MCKSVLNCKQIWNCQLSGVSPRRTAGITVPASLAESPACWNLEFQEVKIFADNFLIFPDIFHIFWRYALKWAAYKTLIENILAFQRYFEFLYKICSSSSRVNIYQISQILNKMEINVTDFCLILHTNSMI